MEDEYTALKTELTDFYKHAFSSHLACRTLPVTQEEVAIIKRLILEVGGHEACQVMMEAWNTARIAHPKMLLVTQIDWVTTRPGWNQRRLTESE